MNKLQKASQIQKANLALLGVGILFGLSSPITRILGTWLLPFSVYFVRCLFALPFTLGSIKILKYEHKFLPKLIIVGLMMSVSTIMFLTGIFETKISLAIFWFYIAFTIVSILIGIFIHKDPVTRNKSFGFISAALALVFLTKVYDSFDIDFGSTLCLGSGIIAGWLAHFQKQFSKIIQNELLTLAQLLGGLLVSAVAMLFVSDYSLLNLNTEGFILSFLFGLLFYGVNALSVFGFKHAQAGVGSILMSTELLIGPLLAFAIFGETLSVSEFFGGILICISVYFVSRPDRNLS